MAKKYISIICAVLIVICTTACKKIETGEQSGNTVQTLPAQASTRIANNFKDVLPDFDFDGEPVENYKEGISYSFSAKCSKSKFRKYVEKVKNAGFTDKAAEGEGYYAARSSDGYYTEITLVNGNITVFIKR